VRWNPGVVLSCISFVARDGEHFFMCFSAIWISSFENFLFSSVTLFFIGSLILREFSFLSSLYVLLSVPYLICSQQRFSPTLWVTFPI
jgi:hypothetical protein